MDAHGYNLHTLIDGGVQFSIPIYQRTYNWNKKQCKRMYDDIINIGKEKGTNSHFLGSITYVGNIEHASVEISSYQIVDGQQRITTLMLLLAAMRNFLNGNEKIVTHDKINLLLFNTSLKNTDEYYKLILTEKDDVSLKCVLNNDEIMHSDNITSNFKFFKDQLAHKSEPLDTIWKGIHRLYIASILIEKDSGDKPQEIFESLNSTGLNLSLSDLIRNYVLMRYDSDKQKKIYNDYWKPMEALFDYDEDDFDEFIKNYLMIQKTIFISKKDTYEQFKEHTKNLDMTNEIKNIHKYSKYYAMLIYASNILPELEKHISNIRTLDTTVAHSLLLKILVDHGDKKISLNDTISVLSLVDSYLVRGFVCGTITKGGNKMFPKLLRVISDTDYVKSLETEIMTDDSITQRFPRDILFREKLEKAQLYSNGTLCKYMLSRLEHDGNNEIVEYESLQIEHIMPQTLTEEWKTYLGMDWNIIHETYLHTIGNLTLTGHNPDISNLQFNLKKQKYEKSHLKITNRICDYDDWNPVSIKARTENLINESIKIWKCPEEPPNISIKHIDGTLEYEHLEGTEIIELWNKLKEKILFSFNYIQFNMTKKYGTFTITVNNDKKIGFCGIMARKDRIYLSYHTKIKDKILELSPFVYDVSNVGRYYSMGELRSTVFTDDDANKVIINLKKLYHVKCEQNMD